jgi:hypothetical protein
MSQRDSAVGNVAIGLAVVVLGFIVYKAVKGSGSVTYTGTAPTPAQTNNAGALANAVMPAAGAAASVVNNIVNALGASNTSGAAVATNSLINYGGGLSTDQSYASPSYNYDSITADIGQDSLAAMAAAGQNTVGMYPFSL